MSEVKRVGQQMQKAFNGSNYAARASKFKDHRPKPYDRPQNASFNAFKRRPFFRARSGINPVKGENNQKNTHGNPELILTTDASNLGWGAVCGDISTGGFWNLN